MHGTVETATNIQQNTSEKVTKKSKRAPGGVKLIEVFLEHRLLSVLVQEGIAFAQFVVLRNRAPKQLRHTGVVRNHQPGNLLCVVLVFNEYISA